MNQWRRFDFFERSTVSLSDADGKVVSFLLTNLLLITSPSPAERQEEASSHWASSLVSLISTTRSLSSHWVFQLSNQPQAISFQCVSVSIYAAAFLDLLLAPTKNVLITLLTLGDRTGMNQSPVVKMWDLDECAIFFIYWSHKQSWWWLPKYYKGN